MSVPVLYKAFKTEEQVEPFFVSTGRTPWPHQIRGVFHTLQRVSQPTTLASPTGSGKSVMITALLEMALYFGLKAVVYTQRKLLTKQTMKNLDSHKVRYGVRSASHPDYHDFDAAIQISSIQTEVARVLKKKLWKLHDSQLVIVDESHLSSNGFAEQIIRMHAAAGAAIIGVTATPIEVSHLYPNLYVAALNSELRKCGAHVPVIVKAPNEFDLSKVGRVKTGEYSVGDIRKHVWSQSIVGNLYDHYLEYNPEMRMALLFAPGVPESIAVAEDFCQRGGLFGITAASIDAKNVWVDGKEYVDDPEGRIRQEVLDRWNEGDIKILCNRYVMREAIDYPGLYHEILATPIGTLKGYLQMVGRIMRKSEATPDHVLLCDHGGNYWRHGSPNEDRDWYDLYRKTDKQITEERFERMKKEPSKDPITCPHCGTVRRSTLSMCPPPPVGCGQPTPTRRRFILQQSGKLKEVSGPIAKGKKKSESSAEQKLWDRLYFPFKNGRTNSMTFSGLKKKYYEKYGSWPPDNLRRMPRPGDDLTWRRLIKHVDYKELQ